MVARILALCRHRGIDRTVLVAILAGALIGPSAASAIAAVLHQATTCSAASSALPTNTTNKETA